MSGRQPVVILPTPGLVLQLIASIAELRSGSSATPEGTASADSSARARRGGHSRHATVLPARS